MVLRRTWAAVGAYLVIFMVGADAGISAQPGAPEGRDLGIAVADCAIRWAVTLIILLRFGLFALTAVFLLGGFVQNFPSTFDLSTWYAGSTLFGLLLTGGVVVYRFYI